MDASWSEEPDFESSGEGIYVEAPAVTKSDVEPSKLRGGFIEGILIPPQGGGVRMPSVSYLDPSKQFEGTDRFLQRFKAALESKQHSQLAIAVAYAKSSGMARLYEPIKAWRDQGGTSANLIVGIDQKGTSIQALQLAIPLFDNVYVSHTGGGSTFHPKLWVMTGAANGKVFVGSHNLTCGGTETNFEAGVELDYSLPTEEDEFAAFQDSIDTITTSPFTKLLDNTLFTELISAGSLFDETVASNKRHEPGSSAKGKDGTLIFPRFNPASPSAIPKSMLAVPAPARKKAAKKAARKATKKRVATSQHPSTVVSAAATGATSLVIQINPHENGEIFLSKLAVNQNPAFFGFPFTGRTVPKKRSNTAYPQRLPDPVVDIVIYDSGGAVSHVESSYGLNTVYYEPKGEIRVTVASHIRPKISPFSILVMSGGTGAIDYHMEIYNPGSTQYANLLAACNQKMPSGGKTSRLFGWL